MGRFGGCCFATVLSSILMTSPSIARADEPQNETPESASLSPRRNTLIIGVDRLVPIITWTKDAGAGGGFGPYAPAGLHDLPRPAVDVALTDHWTIGVSPLVALIPDDRVFVVGGGLRVGTLLPLSARVALWLRLGPVYAYAKDADHRGVHQCALSAEAPFVFTITDHAALSLGLGVGLPLVGKAPFAREGNLGAPHLGLYLGLLAWL
jgi:hypothetical protein